MWSWISYEFTSLSIDPIGFGELSVGQVREYLYIKQT